MPQPGGQSGVVLSRPKQPTSSAPMSQRGDQAVRTVPGVWRKRRAGATVFTVFHGARQQPSSPCPSTPTRSIIYHIAASTTLPMENDDNAMPFFFHTETTLAGAENTAQIDRRVWSFHTRLNQVNVLINAGSGSHVCVNPAHALAVNCGQQHPRASGCTHLA